MLNKLKALFVTMAVGAVGSFIILPFNLNALTLTRTYSIVVSTTTDDIVLPKILTKIAYCESSNLQFLPDGTLRRGDQNKDDIGRFQINLFYHRTQAEKLGFNLFTWDGNTRYALWLYAREGTRPWNWSKKCWEKHKEPN